MAHSDEYPLDESRIAHVNKFEMEWELALSEKSGEVSVVDFKNVVWREDSIFFSFSPELSVPWELFKKDKGGWFSGGGA